MMPRKAFLFAFLVALAGAGLACFHSSSPRDPTPSKTAVADRYSNIHPGDYLGPQSCAACHQEQFAQWEGHAHRRMNCNASDATVLGDFSGAKIEYGDGSVVFEKQADEFLMTLFRQDRLERQYRVTRTVGSRIEQMYIGVQTQGPEPPGDAVYSREGKLPFGYWLKRQSWLPDSYFDSDRNAEPASVGGMAEELYQVHKTINWQQTCIYCHNTYPYQHRIFFEEGTGFPPSDIHLHGSPRMVRDWGPALPGDLVTLGISCESCHFGGREHVVEKRESRFVPTSPQLKVRGTSAQLDAAGRPSAYVINAICSQCHCAKISRYPNGAGTWNSREGLDLTASACASQLKCTDCHDPHRSRHDGGMLEPEQIVATCIRCHAQYREETRLAKHTRHATSAKVSCLDCHMPRIVQGLEEVVRSHHISSPVDERMLKNAAPNACNLCHLDRSIEWTLAELKKGWGREISTASWSREHRTELDSPLGQVWLNHHIPVVRLVATGAYARSPLGKVELPRLLQSLDDPYSVNRMFGLFAIEEILGRQLSESEYAPLASASRRKQQVELLVEKLENSAAANTPQSSPGFTSGD